MAGKPRDRRVHLDEIDIAPRPRGRPRKDGSPPGSVRIPEEKLGTEPPAPIRAVPDLPPEPEPKLEPRSEPKPEPEEEEEQEEQEEEEEEEEEEDLAPFRPIATIGQMPMQQAQSPGYRPVWANRNAGNPGYMLRITRVQLNGVHESMGAVPATASQEAILEYVNFVPGRYLWQPCDQMNKNQGPLDALTFPADHPLIRERQKALGAGGGTGNTDMAAMFALLQQQTKDALEALRAENAAKLALERERLDADRKRDTEIAKARAETEAKLETERAKLEAERKKLEVGSQTLVVQTLQKSQTDIMAIMAEQRKADRDSSERMIAQMKADADDRDRRAKRDADERDQQHRRDMERMKLEADERRKDEERRGALQREDDRRRSDEDARRRAEQAAEDDKRWQRRLEELVTSQKEKVQAADPLAQLVRFGETRSTVLTALGVDPDAEKAPRTWLDAGTDLLSKFLDGQQKMAELQAQMAMRAAGGGMPVAEAQPEYETVEIDENGRETIVPPQQQAAVNPAPRMEVARAEVGKIEVIAKSLGQIIDERCKAAAVGIADQKVARQTLRSFVLETEKKIRAEGGKVDTSLGMTIMNGALTIIRNSEPTLRYLQAVSATLALKEAKLPDEIIKQIIAGGRAAFPPDGLFAAAKIPE